STPQEGLRRRLTEGLRAGRAKAVTRPAVSTSADSPLRRGSFLVALQDQEHGPDPLLGGELGRALLGRVAKAELEGVLLQAVDPLKELVHAALADGHVDLEGLSRGVQTVGCLHLLADGGRLPLAVRAGCPSH